MIALARPRSPAAPPAAALYESHYLTAVDPAGGRALWLRCTALKRAGEPARPTAWLTFFDASAAAPRALRATAPDPVSDPGEGWWRCALGEMGPGGAWGALDDGWMHAGALGHDRRGWLDLALVRIAFGPVITPWIASGALELDGRRYAPAPLRRVTCERAGERTTVRVSFGAAAAVALEIAAAQRATVTWDYASPRGPGRRVENCSVADATISVTDGGVTRSLEVIGTVAVEHGRA